MGRPYFMPSIIPSCKAIKHLRIQVIRLLTIIPVIRYNITMADIYSVKEAAKKLGLDPSQVRRLLKDKIIDGKKLGHDWVVLSLNYKKKKFGVGRKPKAK